MPWHVFNCDQRNLHMGRHHYIRWSPMTETRNDTLVKLHSFISFVVESPPAFTIEPESQIVKLGTGVTLSCSANRPAQPYMLYWTKNSKKITEGENVQVNNGELTIVAFRQGRKGDEGSYRCILGNAMGTIVSKEARLQGACKY